MTEESKSKRFSLFKKSQNVKKVEATEVQERAFDETTFQFALTGGKYQTTLIQASATLKSGPNAGMPLPLQCSWYRANLDVDFQQIEGVTGAFYQPSADDVGCKINVHAVPVSEVEDYTGMPAFAEVGPLMLDPKIQKDVDEMIRANSASFSLKVLSSENIPLPRSPCTLQLSLDKSTLRLSIAHEDISSVSICPGFPQVRMSPYPSTDLEITLSPSLKLSCQEDSSEVRDLIAVTLRSFAGMNLGESNTGNSDSLLRIQQLSEALTKAAREREAANTQVSIVKEREAEGKRDRDELRKELEETRKGLEREIEGLKERHKAESLEKDRKISTLTQERQKLIDQMDLTAQQCNFLRQDVGLYKSQMAEMEQKTENTLIKLNALKLVHMAVREKVTELKGRKNVHGEVWEQIVEMVSGQGDSTEISHHSSKPSSIKSGKLPDESQDVPSLSHFTELQATIAQLHLEVSKSQSDLMAAQDQVLTIEGERNFFKKKCESLTRENEHLMSQLGRNPKEISEFEKQKEVFEAEKQKCTQELVTAREQASLYRTAMEVTQRKLEEEIHRNTEMRKTLKHNKVKASPEAFQNIINSLTETLTDRELALNDQKDINRSLMNRVTELEAIVLSVSERI